jgi:hypothetical protein
LDLNQVKYGDGWQLRWKFWLLVLGRYFGGYGLVVATDIDFYSGVSSFGVRCRRFDGRRLRWWYEILVIEVMWCWLMPM